MSWQKAVRGEMEMNENAKIITTLCSYIGAEKSQINPLQPKEWGILAANLKNHGLQPADLPTLSDEDMRGKLQLSDRKIHQIHTLLDRAPSLAFEIDKLAGRGIQIITRADKEYPRILKLKLESKCPPLFYTAGNLSLCNHRGIGFSGSRKVTDDDLVFTKKMVAKVQNAGYGIVTGGAKGIDQISMQEALETGGFVICYIADSMLRKIKDKIILQGIMDGKLVLLSSSKPDAVFNVGMAMMRNKYIYAQSDGTIVVRSDKGKGGTWAGATENMKADPVWSVPLCWEKDYDGNQELIKMGCIPIDEDWDVDLKAARIQYQARKQAEEKAETIVPMISASSKMEMPIDKKAYTGEQISIAGLL